MAKTPGLQPRRAALKMLDAVLRRGETLEQNETAALRGLPASDAGLARAIAAETLRWLGKQKNVKPCPNCHEMIQKNGGCDHMTCRPPGGCGHEFWFTCGCDYKKPHTCQAKAGQRY